jgi:hypothetical protein
MKRRATLLFTTTTVARPPNNTQWNNRGGENAPPRPRTIFTYPRLRKTAITKIASATRYHANTP